jgi:transcriptional regulator with XRE-family HTH domain
MTAGGSRLKTFRPAKKRTAVSVGESVRIVRELQGLSQNQLAERTGIPQATLSAIEKTAFASAWSGRRYSLERSSAIPPFWFSRAGKMILRRQPNDITLDAARGSK